MTKLWMTSLFSVALMMPAWTQETPAPPTTPDEEELTPEKVMQLLSEAQRLMLKSEELLHNSSRGKALETEKDLLEKLKELEKEEPGLLSVEIMKKVKKLMDQAQKKQKSSLEKITEIIKKTRA